MTDNILIKVLRLRRCWLLFKYNEEYVKTHSGPYQCLLYLDDCKFLDDLDGVNLKKLNRKDLERMNEIWERWRLDRYAGKE